MRGGEVVQILGVSERVTPRRPGRPRLGLDLDHLGVVDRWVAGSPAASRILRQGARPQDRGGGGRTLAALAVTLGALVAERGGALRGLALRPRQLLRRRA